METTRPSDLDLVIVHPCNALVVPSGLRADHQAVVDSGLIPTGPHSALVLVALDTSDHCAECKPSKRRNRDDRPIVYQLYDCGHDYEYSLSDDLMEKLVSARLLRDDEDWLVGRIQIVCSCCEDCQGAPCDLLRAAFVRRATAKHAPGSLANWAARRKTRTLLGTFFNAHLAGELPKSTYDELLPLAAQACINQVPQHEMEAWLKEGEIDESSCVDLWVAMTSIAMTSMRLG